MNCDGLSLRVRQDLFGSTTSKFRSDHLGFAAVTEEGGELAAVFYGRIESLGRGGDLSNLLGLATAHELGHLLLGSKAPLTKASCDLAGLETDLHRDRQKRFLFTSGQAERIRTKGLSQLSKIDDGFSQPQQDPRE